MPYGSSIVTVAPKPLPVAPTNRGIRTDRWTRHGSIHLTGWPFVMTGQSPLQKYPATRSACFCQRRKKRSLLLRPIPCPPWPALQAKRDLMTGLLKRPCSTPLTPWRGGPATPSLWLTSEMPVSVKLKTAGSPPSREPGGLVTGMDRFQPAPFNTPWIYPSIYPEIY